MKGVLAVISGFSGVGKGTVVKRMREKHPFTLSVSATTRAPRPEDQEGVTYFFITKDEFEKRIQEGWFLEYAQYTDNSYGTPKQKVLDALERGEDVILEIEANGAKQVKAQYPEALLIYILPPSFAELKRRLTDRGTETPERIEKRLSKALEEFKEIPYYDRVVVNESVESCADEMYRMIEAHRNLPGNQKEMIDRLEREAHAVMQK